MSDLAFDLNFLKSSAELLSSQLKEKNFLVNGVWITIYWSCYEVFLSFFTKEEDLVYCKDVSGILNKLSIKEYRPE